MERLKIFLLICSICFFPLICQGVSDGGIKSYISLSVSFSKAVPKEGDEVIIKVKVSNDTDKSIKNIHVEVFDGQPENGQKISEQLISEISDQDIGVIQVKWVPIKNGLYCIYVVATAEGIKGEIFKEIPVVTKELYFAWRPGKKETNDKLKYVNVSLANKENVSYWKEKGVIPCVWKGAGKGRKADEYAEYLSKGIVEIGAEGIMLDELGWYEKSPDDEESLQGLKKFTQEHPEVFTTVCVCGSLKPELCNLTKNLYRKQGIDLLMLESYFNYQIPRFNTYTRYAYFDQRIKMARDYDVLSNSIMILGINDSKLGYEVTAEDLEAQFIYIRREAPEMPGIRFFWGENEEISLLADKLCYKYFISPVVTTWDRDILFSNYHPTAGEEISIYANIYNIGGMDAKDIVVTFFCGDPRERGKQIGRVVIPILSPKEGVPTGIKKVSTKWKAKKGYQQIYVQITSKDSNTTILEGESKRLIFVR